MIRAVLLGHLTVFLLTACTTSTFNTDELHARAVAGDGVAQYELALAFDAGRGVRRDAVQAAKWYLRAAEQGHAASQNRLGLMYLAGEGVPRDEAVAAGWFDQAAAQGSAEAFVHLGELFELGRGVPQDGVRAAGLYREGARHGSLRGMLKFGMACWQGNGVEADRAEAWRWLEMARFYSEQTADMRLRRRIRNAQQALLAEMSPAELAEGRQHLKVWGASGRVAR